MNRNAHAARQLPPTLAWAAAALALAIGAGLLLAQMLMSPPAAEMRDLAVYLAVSGVATVGGGWLLIRLLDRTFGLAMRTKAFLGAIIGSGVALLNVFFVANAMFISEAHDLKLLVALLVFSAVVTLFFSLWVAHATSARVGAVADGIRSLSDGALTTRVSVEGRDEVALLAEDVNSLAGRLQSAEEQRAALDRERRELTAAISHDLRTPLASVRAMVEALDDEVVDDPAEVRRYYGTIRREIDRLSRMIDDLFELAQMDAGALRLNRRPVALQEIVAEVIDAMQVQAQQAGVTLAVRVDGRPPEAALDGARIERAIANLVRNALEHTPAGGTIDVGVFAEGDTLAFSIADTGDGIDDADLPHIWQRFYRAEKSRRRAASGADGAGLGLAITRGIIESHGGRIDVHSEQGRGTRFDARIPIAPPSAVI